MLISSAARVPFRVALQLGQKPILSALPAALASTTQLLASSEDAIELEGPRVRSVAYMASALILHFGGYEFMRNSCLALFTSREFGFTSAFAFPLANGLILPFSLVMLWIYSRIMDAHGPRGTLRKTTLGSLCFVLATVASLTVPTDAAVNRQFQRVVVGVAFLFQNTYQHLLQTQHWSFMSSVVDPEHGSRWFPTLAGLSSMFASLLGGLIPYIVPHTGISGLMLVTAFFLVGSSLCGDRAYALSQEYGFYPQQSSTKKSETVHGSGDNKEISRATKIVQLFKRVPTLQALLGEVIAYQCLSTILNVAFVRSLKDTIPDDIERSAYTGRFYGLVNAIATALQFTVLPFLLKRFEQATFWRTTPIWSFLFCAMLVAKQNHLPLYVLASAFFLAKILDYSFRTYFYISVFQPLDFESRYLGKETIGLFGGRFGKSAMSLVLSGLTAAGLASLPRLCRLSLVFNSLWIGATWWVAHLIPSRAQAQAIVAERTREEQDDA